MERQRINGKAVGQQAEASSGAGDWRERNFDGLAKALAGNHARRGMLRLIGGAALAVVAGGAALELEAEAKRGRRRRKNKNSQNNNNNQNQNQNQNLPPGSPCQSSAQCISDYICEVAVNAANSDRTCCGALGAGCGAEDENGDFSAPYCCVGHECVYHPSGGTWTCEYVSAEP